MKPDQTLWVAALPRLGEQRQSTLAAARTQQSRRRVRVVARHDGRVEDLFEGVLARLARLELDDVQDLVGVGDHQVVEASSIRARSTTAVRAHSRWASRAARQAARMSSGVPRGTSASVVPAERGLHRQGVAAAGTSARCASLASMAPFTRGDQICSSAVGEALRSLACALQWSFGRPGPSARQRRMRVASA